MNTLHPNTARLIRRAKRMQDQRLADAHVRLAEARVDFASLVSANQRMPEVVTDEDVSNAALKVTRARVALERATRIHAIAQ